MEYDIPVSNANGGVGSTTGKIEAVLKSYLELGPNHKAVLEKLQLLFSSDEYGNVKRAELKNYFHKVISMNDRLKQEIIAAGVRQ